MKNIKNVFFSEEELAEMELGERMFIRMFMVFPYFLGIAVFIFSTFSGIWK